MRNTFQHLTFLLVASSAILLITACQDQASRAKTTFRDLNKNGKMDVYEDASRPVEERVNDLLAQMNVEEKAGMMFINGLFINAVVKFTIVAFVLFLVVKAINEAERKLTGPKEVKAAAPPPPTAEEKLLTEIRDALKKK